MTAAARVYHGQWITDCRRRYCASAEPLTAGQTQMTCSNCGQVTAVTWPDDILAIEALLAARPVPQTRNWFPGETLAGLAAENREHGVM